MRLDVYLTEKGFVKSRSKAAESIKLGLISVNGKTDLKPSLDITGDEEVTVLGRPHNFVGRGGVKLDFALEYFDIDVTNMYAVDIGASTGGFTDCLLQRGAAGVLAVDSGHDQLDPTLVTDERVCSLEGFNARSLTPANLERPADIAVTDVSFISQTLILPAAYSILRDEGVYVGLVKPQFECGKAALGKNGIVKDDRSRRMAIDKVATSAISLGFSPKGIVKSPITGGDGNSEYLIYLKKSSQNIPISFDKMVDEVFK